MPLLVKKVYAYITHRGRLLVFAHPEHPEAGLQVPGGTLEPGEHPAAGVQREAEEETGLAGLELVRPLGERRHNLADYGLDQVHHRFYYHLRVVGEPPERWRHYELTPSDGSPGPIPLDFFWAPLPDGVPPLIAYLDELLPELLKVKEKI
jgi:8-oxo-dGTP pyrophosphatase MutT (NUDIX family)